MKTILVVDDEPTLADTLTAILQHSGYNAIAAYNASDAPQVLHANAVDLMISDVIIPGMNGFELAIYSNRNYPSTVVLLISGNAATQEIMTAYGTEAHSIRAAVQADSSQANARPRRGIACAPAARTKRKQTRRKLGHSGFLPPRK